jgi:hypothetical protein
VEATEGLLSKERSSSKELRAAGEALRSELGGVKEQLATTASDLLQERATAAEMREQLLALKTEYLAMGGCLGGHCWQGGAQPGACGSAVLCRAAACRHLDSGCLPLCVATRARSTGGAGHLSCGPQRASLAAPAQLGTG